MRRYLCALVLGLLTFAGTAQNWAQEQAHESSPAAAATLAKPAPDDKPPAKFTTEDVALEFKRLTGVWRPKNAMLAGEKLPDEVCQRIQLDLSSGRFKSLANGNESAGTIVLDLATEPRAMDMTFENGSEAGKTIKCVYKFEDDNLHVAYSMAFDNVRPTQFESNQDNKQLLIVYQHHEEPKKPIDQPAAVPETKRDK